MIDFFEIDFIDIESKKSGDAIPLRYCVSGDTYIHVTDGGFQGSGEAVVNHIRKYYEIPRRIDHVVVTHPDGDHAGGLRTVLDEFDVSTLWMLRPWEYTEELLPKFPTYTSADRLRSRLRSIYPNIVALEELAQEKGIPIAEPFQGAHIGEFGVLAPSKERYLDLVASSERTPESMAAGRDESKSQAGGLFAEAARQVVQFVKAVWGAENFSEEPTSAEN
ncbi:MBL fold metallo-hydrolase, partial [Labilibacter sediminis]